MNAVEQQLARLEEGQKLLVQQMQQLEQILTYKGSMKFKPSSSSMHNLQLGASAMTLNVSTNNPANTSPPSAPLQGSASMMLKIPNGAHSVLHHSSRHSGRVRIAPPPEPKEEAPQTFLSDHPFVTVIDFMYWFAATIDMLYVVIQLGTHNWDSLPDEYAYTWLCVSTTFHLFVFPYVRTRVATTVRWELLEDKSAIWDHYKVSWFPFDVLTSLPYDLFLVGFSVTAFRWLSLVRVLHLFRVLTLFDVANPLVETRAVKVIMLHLSGLVWGVFTFSFAWMLLNSATFERRGFTQFEIVLSGVYWSIQTSTSVGYGDILPAEHDWANRLLCCVCMLIGVAVYSYSISVISVSVIFKDAVKQQLKEKKSKLHSLMQFYEVPWGLQKQAFSLYPRILEATKKDYADVMALLPTFVQYHIQFYVRLRTLMKVSMFKNIEKEISRSLCQVMEEMYFAPNEIIMVEGEIGNEMYFVVHGVVEVVTTDAITGEEKQLTLLKDGSWFGEIALLKSTKRAASVRAVTSCDAMRLGKTDFQEILQKYPDSEFAKEIELEVKKRSGGDARRTSVALHSSLNARNPVDPNDIAITADTLPTVGFLAPIPGAGDDVVSNSTHSSDSEERRGSVIPSMGYNIDETRSQDDAFSPSMSPRNQRSDSPRFVTS